MKKFLALMALLLCFMVLFVACDNTDEPQSSEKPTDPIVVPAGCEHAYDNACDADCNLCGEKREPAAHVEETIAAVAPTCTKVGLTEGKICTVCGVITKAQEVAPVVAHTTVTVAGTPATCTTAGKTDGEVCTTCGTVVVAQEIILATGHDVKVVEGKAATCTEDGLTSGKKCSACNVWIQEQAVIPATGHAEATVPSVEPTCTTSGYIGATVCTVCNEVLKAERKIPALGHNEVAIPEVEATCTKAGSEGGRVCSNCGIVTVEPTPTKLAKHTPQRVSGYEATCTTAGLTDGTVCKDCGVVIKAQEVIPATHGELVVLEAIAPTCTKVGYTEGAKCSVCDAIVVGQEVLPYAHTYNYTCDTTCTVCGDYREAYHEYAFLEKGAIACVYGCGNYYKDAVIDPATFASGEDLYNRIIRSGNDLSSALKNGALSYNEEEGYVRVSGKDSNGDPGMDHVIAVPFGPSWDGAGQSVTQRYLVVRFRTDSRAAELRFVTWNRPTMIVKSGIGTGGEWNTVIIDLEDSADAGERIDIRCNIGAEYTDFSHIASFKSLDDAKLYANFVGEMVDGECAHVEYVEGWNGPVCSNCYAPATPVTSHEGAEIYNAIDPTCPDFSLVTDNGSQGVTVNGLGTSLGGASANFVLTSDVDFGKYMLVVYKMDTGAAYLGLAYNGDIATYRELAQTPGLWTVCGYGITGLEASNTLEFICNFGGASSSVGIQAVYTFNSLAAAEAYAAKLAAQCFHDATTVNYETGHVVCDACGAIQGATAEWPLDLNNGFVTTPNFVAGTSMMDPGVQEYHYFYYAETDHRLVLDYYGTNISIYVNGDFQMSETYDPSLNVAVKAGDKVEVIVYANWDEETWTMITDGVFFIVDKALPGSANNPFELVLGEITTPEFVLGTSMMDPGVQQYSYKWVAIDDGKLILSELENISWIKNGEWGEGYVVDVLKGDVVEITVFMGMDENWNWLTTPVTFSAEFDVVHRMAFNEDGSITCNKGCHNLVPATYSAGQTLADKASNGNYGNHGQYNEEGYMTIPGASTAADAGTDKVYNINNGARERYVVLRYRTTDPAVTIRFVTYGAPAETWVDLGTNGAWQTVVVDAGAAYSGWMEFRCNIYMNGNVPSEGAQTDISHIVTFATIEEAQAYANYVNIFETGVCPHNGYKTEVITPATCVTPGLSKLSCDCCGLVIEQVTGGSHKFVVDDAVVSCMLCGHVATNSVHVGADIYANSSVDSGSLIDKGANGVTVAGQTAAGAGNFLSIKSDTNFGQHIILVYSINTRWGYIGSGLDAGCYAAAGDMDVGAVRMDYFQNANIGTVLNLLCNFNDGNNNTTETNIIAVYTFDSFEAAAKYVESLGQQVTTSHVGTNLVASVNSAEQGDAANMTVGTDSVTVTGVGGGILGTTRIRLKNETGANFGQYVVILYKSNAINADDGQGYLGITHTTDGLVYNNGMNPSTENYAVYNLGLPTGGTLGSEIELLCNFGGNAETWTTIYGVYTFETAEAAAAFVAFIG